MKLEDFESARAAIEFRWAVALQQFFVGMEFAVLAGVVQRDVSVSSFFALVDFATVERFRVHVNAYRALLKFRQIQNLVHGFERIHVHGIARMHFVDFRGNDPARAARGVFFFHAKILNFQAADGRRHPAVLVAVIVDAAGLADFPTDGHAFEKLIFENEVAGVIPSREKTIFFERFRRDSVADDVFLDIFKLELALGNRCEALNPVSDGESFNREICWHGRKIITRNAKAEAWNE